jgi:hypothetical protein
MISTEFVLDWRNISSQAESTFAQERGQRLGTVSNILVRLFRLTFSHLLKLDVIKRLLLTPSKYHNVTIEHCHASLMFADCAYYRL